ncbi:MAG: hypothetical protein ACRDHB_05270 [Actinomycetota bacterium]
MLAQISFSDNPCCEFINDFPQWFFLLVHVVIFLIALVFSVRSFGAGEGGFGWGFMFFALAEISYLTYHVNLTLFLLAHTVSEVLVLLGILMIAGSAARKGLFGRTAREAARRTGP